MDIKFGIITCSDTRSIEQDTAGAYLKDAIIKKALEHPQALTHEQLYMLDYQLYTPMSTMYNLYQMMKFDKNIIDMEKMAAAVRTAAHNHPAILTTFYFNEDGDPMQKYSPERWLNKQ